MMLCPSLPRIRSVSERQAEICSSLMRQKSDTNSVTGRALGQYSGEEAAPEVQNSKLVGVLLVIS